MLWRSHGAVHQLATRTEALLAEQVMVREPAVIDRLLSAREERRRPTDGRYTTYGSGLRRPETFAAEVTAVSAAQSHGAPVQKRLTT